MIRSVIPLLLPALALAAPVPKGPVPVIDVRDPDGKVLLAADDLASYDWGTHTLALKEGAKAPFAKALKAAKGFAVCIDGKPAFAGRFVPPTISSTRKGPVIVLPDITDEVMKSNTVVIRDGYHDPSADGEDERQVPKLKAALEKAGKLKAEK